MKRILSVFLALAVAASTATVAFAEGGEKPDSGYFSGIATLDEATVYPGDTVYLDIDYFYGKWKEKDDEWDDKKEKLVTVTKTIDVEDEPIGNLDKEYHTVSASWTKGSQYIESVYFNDGDDYVTIEIKGGVYSTVDREIAGTIKIVEKNIPNRPSVTYTCKIERGSLTLIGVDEKSRMEQVGDKEFGLPYDYQTKQVRFSTEEGDSYGTFVGEFTSELDGSYVAEYRVRINDQSPLFLGFSEVVGTTLENKYPNADLRILNWTARPTFDREGKLSIFMDPDEYIYGVNSDNTLYRLGGSYETASKAYVITTKTLGSYLISDISLNVSGSDSTGSGTTASTSSSAPASTAPSSTAPSSTSTVPASSAPAPSSSSEESEPEDSEPEDIEPEESSSSAVISRPDDDEENEDSGDKETAEKKGFPLVPVLLGVLGIAIVIFGVVVAGNRSSGQRARTRRRRYDDDWDD